MAPPTADVQGGAAGGGGAKYNANTTYQTGNIALGEGRTQLSRTIGGMVDTTKEGEEKKVFEKTLGQYKMLGVSGETRPPSAGGGTLVKFDSADWGRPGSTGGLRKTPSRRGIIPDFVAELPRTADGTPMLQVRVPRGPGMKGSLVRSPGAVEAGRELLLPTAEGRPETPGSAWSGGSSTPRRPLSRTSSGRTLGPGTLTRKGSLSARSRPEFVARLREKGESPYEGRALKTKDVIEWNNRFAEALYEEGKRLRERVPAKPGAAGGSARVHRTMSRSGLQWPSQTAQDLAQEMDDLILPQEESTDWADALGELAKDKVNLGSAIGSRPTHATWGRPPEDPVIDREDMANATLESSGNDLLSAMADAVMPTNLSTGRRDALEGSREASPLLQGYYGSERGQDERHPQNGDGVERTRPPEALSPTVLRDFTLPSRNAHPSRQQEIDEFSSKADYLTWLEEWLNNEDLSMDKKAFGQIAVYCESKLRGARESELAAVSAKSPLSSSRRSSAKEKQHLTPNAFRLAVCVHLLDRLPVAPPGHELHALWTIIRGEVRNALYTTFEDPAPERRLMSGLAGAKEASHRYLTMEPWFDRYSTLLKDYTRLYETINKLGELGVKDSVDVKRLLDKIRVLESHLASEQEKKAIEIKARISRRLLHRGMLSMWNTLRAHTAHCRWQKANKLLLDGKRAVKRQQKRASRIIEEMVRRHMHAVMHRLFSAWVLVVQEEKEMEAVMARGRVEEAMHMSNKNLNETLNTFQNVTMVLFQCFKGWTSFVVKEKQQRVNDMLDDMEKTRAAMEKVAKTSSGYLVVMERMSQRAAAHIMAFTFNMWRGQCAHGKEIAEMREKLRKYEMALSGTTI